MVEKVNRCIPAAQRLRWQCQTRVVQHYTRLSMRQLNSFFSLLGSKWKRRSLLYSTNYISNRNKIQKLRFEQNRGESGWLDPFCLLKSNSLKKSNKTDLKVVKHTYDPSVHHPGRILQKNPSHRPHQEWSCMNVISNEHHLVKVNKRWNCD